MANYTSDPTASQAIADVRDTLERLTVGGAKVFGGGVTVHDDPDGFTRTADTLNAPAAGIIVAPTQRDIGLDASDQCVKLPLRIVVGVRRERAAGDGDASGETAGLVELVRKSLLADRSRGGVAQLSRVRGQLISGTNVEGDAVPLRAKPNQAFYAVALPVAIGWRVPRPN